MKTKESNNNILTCNFNHIIFLFVCDFVVLSLLVTLVFFIVVL